MSRQPSKPKFVLDWITVSYRSAFAAGLGFLAVVAVVLWWFVFSGGGARRDAAEAITQARERVEEAASLPTGPGLDEVRRGAGVALDEADGSFADGNYEEARVSAIRADSLAEKALEMARGAATPASQSHIRQLEGDVRIKRAGEFSWEPAVRNMTLRDGDQIKTAANARAEVMYFDRTVTAVEAGSLLEIKRVYEDPATRVRQVREKLSWGEILASTQKNNVRGSYHEVETDKITARPDEASALRVSVDKESRSAAFDALSGGVQLTTPDRKEFLAAGERVTASAQGRLSAKESLPGAPRLVAPPDQRVFALDDPAGTKLALSWERVAGAAKYRLVISNRQLFTNPLHEADRSGTSAEIDAPVGEYFWRVAGLSATGARGPFSEDRRFRVTAQRIRDRGDTTPPILEITEKVQTGPMLILNGRTEPGALLWVNDEKVEVSDDGSFYAVVKLGREGVNDVVLSAQDATGNVKKLVQRAYVDAL